MAWLFLMCVRNEWIADQSLSTSATGAGGGPPEVVVEIYSEKWGNFGPGLLITEMRSLPEKGWIQLKGAKQKRVFMTDLQWVIP